MDWSPFLVCGPEERAPSPRGLRTPEGLGDRLRTAAFAELQAREAFLWAADALSDAAPELRAAWRRFAADEDRHLRLLLERMAALGVRPEERAVSDRLWRSLSACRAARDFSSWMKTAEERGRAAEESFARSLAGIDPVTAAIFERIAADEIEHVAFAARQAA